MGVLRRRLGRFAGIGVLNTLIDMGLYALLLPHLAIVPAQIVSSGVAMVFSFIANARFAFGASGLTWRAAGSFFGINALNLWVLQPLVILGAAWAIHLAVDGHDYAVALVAKLVSFAVSLTINFVVYDRWVWPRTSLSAP
ncbi:MAG: GtrA family protein [Nocardioides sp.]|uniref:GtrA family protein n=1 Tax=Nocardioides sp. TaxID=35761 RepID=UPI0039E50348